MTTQATDNTDHAWADTPLPQRLRIIKALRHALATQPERFVAPLRGLPTRRDDAETLSAEVLPLAAACKWLENHAGKWLRPRKLGRRGRPMWLWGVASEIHREPMGDVLIIAPGNFPLLLPGVQIIQALAAGNRVWVKPPPASGSREVILQLAEVLRDAGLPAGVLTVLGADPAEAIAMMASFDKVFLTGSEATGEKVQAACARHGIPCVMELSGCDAVFVLDGADVSLAAKCVAFGLLLNNSATCIAPRRVFVHPLAHDAFVEQLKDCLREAAPAKIAAAASDSINEVLRDAQQQGAELHGDGLPIGETMRPTIVTGGHAGMRLMQTDVFGPVVSVVSTDAADAGRREAGRCGYRLGASVFGPQRQAYALAAKLDVGCVVINDGVVPTADPRLPFAGRGRSGFGATRGADGLLEMTRVKAIASRRWKIHPHLRPNDATTWPMLKAILELAHAPRCATRVRAGLGLLRLTKRSLADADQE